MELLVFQSMWAMEQLPWRGDDWTFAEQVERIAAAGFDGAAVEFEDYAAAKEITGHLREHDLRWSIECAPRDLDELRMAIDRAD